MPSNARIAASVRERFVALVGEHYADFGPTLACEYLVAKHGYTGSSETLRGWMIEAGLWKTKRTLVRRIHSPRERRARLGEVVQIDGSPHAWFEHRAGKCCLIAFIDDATGALLQACFYPVESTNAYLHSLQCQGLRTDGPWRCTATVTASSPSTTPRTPSPPSSSAPWVN